MKVVLGTFNDMFASNKYIVGTKEFVQKMIDDASKPFGGKILIDSTPPSIGVGESAEDFQKRASTINKENVIGHLSNFEITEVKQDYLFNKLMVTADLNLKDDLVLDTNCSFALRAFCAPINVEDVVYGNIPCTYKIDNAVVKIITWDLCCDNNVNEIPVHRKPKYLFPENLFTDNFSELESKYKAATEDFFSGGGETCNPDKPLLSTMDSMQIAPEDDSEQPERPAEQKELNGSEPEDINWPFAPITNEEKEMLENSNMEPRLQTAPGDE